MGTLGVGAITGGTYNKITITTPATGATLTLAEGSNLITAGAFATTFTTTDTTGVTLPTSGTLYGTATGSITSAQLATSLSNETGTGVAVFGTSPTFTTTILPSAAGATAIGTELLPFSSIFIGDEASKSVKLVNTAAAADVVLTLPSTTGTLALIDSQVFTTYIESPYIILGSAATAADAGAIRLPNATGNIAWEKATAGTDTTLGLNATDDMVLALVAADDLFQITTGNLKIGAGTQTQTLDGADAYITGFLEVDGIIYADGGVTTTTLTAGSANSLTLGTDSAGGVPAIGSVIFHNATNTNHFTITSGTSGAAIGWTLPTAAPAGNDYLVKSSTAGVLGYTDPATFQGVLTNSAGLLGALSDEVGTGYAVFNTAPTFVTSITPTAAGATTIGTTALEWGNVYLTDSAVIYGQADQSATLTSSASLWTANNFGVTTQFKLPSSDADPTATAGYLRHDSTITNFTGGGLVYYNGAAIKQLVDMTTATAQACTEAQVIVYDATADLWKCADAPAADADIVAIAALTVAQGHFIVGNADPVWSLSTYHLPIVACTENQILKADASGNFLCGADADTGGATAWNAIGDAAAPGSIDFVTHQQTITGQLNSAGAMLTMTNTVTDLGADVSLIDFGFKDSDDANAFVFRVYDTDATSTILASMTGLGALSVASITATGAVVPGTADTYTLGSATAEWSDLFLGDGAVIYGQINQSATLTSSASLWTANNFAITGYLALGADPADTGSIRLPNAGYIYSEADVAGTDISVIGVDSAEIIQIGASGASGVTITPALTVTGHVTLEAITSTGATGTGKLVFDTAPVFVTSIEAPFLILGTTATAADAGAIRLPNAAYIMAEADTAGTDISIIGVDSAEIIQIGASGASGVTITPALTVTGHLTFESITSTGATGTGKLVFDTAPVFTTSIEAPFLVLGTATTAADTGAIRLPNASYIFSEAAPDGTDISVIGVDSGEIIQIGASGASAVTITPATTITGALTLSSTVNKVTITPPASAATLTLVDGSSLITVGAYAVTLTATGTTGVTLPTSGTLLNNTLADGYIYVGSVTTNVATARLMSGDVTISNTGVTAIGADKVNATHIDWGTGTNQIDIDDIPDSATYQKVLADDVDTAGHVNRLYDSDGVGYITITGLSVARAITLVDAAQTLVNLASNQIFTGTNTFQTVQYFGDASNAGTFRVYDGSSNYTTVGFPAAAGNMTFNLPITNGTSGNFLQTDGSGNTSWTITGIATGAGDCTGGACLDGTSDGGTWIKFYDAQGATQLIGGDTAGVVVLTLPTTTSTLMGTGFSNGDGLIFGDTYPPDAAGEIGYSGGVLAYYDGTGSRTVMAEARASGGLLFGDSTPDTEGEIGYASDVLSYWGTSATRSVAALERAQTFTANNVFGDADTDTLTLRSMLIGGNSREVQINAGTRTAPTYPSAAPTQDLYVKGNVEVAGTIYGAGFTGSVGTEGQRGITLTSNNALTPTADQIYFVLDGLHFSEAGAEKHPMKLEDAQTATGLKIFEAGIYLGDTDTTTVFKLSDGSTNYVTIAVPAIAADYTLTLPTTDGNASQYLKTDGSGTLSWDSPTATAAGSDTQVQFNDGGSALGGDSGFTFNKTTNALTLGANAAGGTLVLYNELGVTDYTSQAANATITLPAATATLIGTGANTFTGAQTLKAGSIGVGGAPLYFTSGTNLTSAAVGAMEFDGTYLYFSPSTTRYSIPLALAAAPLNFTTGGTTARLITLPDAAITVARIDAGQTFTGIQAMTSPDLTTSVTTTSTSFTAFAGATTLLTIGGTGSSASLFAPSTLDATTSITGAIRTSGGISAAKALNIGTTIIAGTSIETPFLVLGTSATAADAGAIRLPNATNIAWELAATGTDVTFGVNSSDDMVAALVAATDIFQITTGNFKVGAGSNGNTFDGADAYITGFLEVDGIIYADGGISGAHNGTVGATTPAAGVFTTLTANAVSSLTLGSTTGPIKGSAIFWGATSGSSVLSAPDVAGSATAIVLPSAAGTLQLTTGSPAGFIIASQAIGDLLYASSTTAWARLGIQAAGYILAGGTIPAWSNAPQITTIELGAATDTTLSRVSAGVIAVEGVTLATLTAPTFVTSVALPATLTSAAAVTWTLMDNQASGLSFGATGAADILKIGTLDAGPGVTVTGFLTATGTITGSLTGNVTGNASGSAATLTGTLANVASSTSANLATCLSDEQGTGVAVFSDSPTFVDDITIAAAGVKLTGANGALTILGLGDGADEDVKIDLNTTANTIIISSPASSATTLSLSALNLVTTGTIQGGILINSDADGMDAAAMTAVGVRGTLFIATGAGTWILPTAVVGMSVCVKDSGTSHDLIVDVTTNDYIILKGTTLVQNAGITNAATATTGDFVCLVATAAGYWSTMGMGGAWVSQ
jgi:hypothetical protein